MSRNLITVFLILVLLTLSLPGTTAEVSALQLFYLVKQVFPAAEEVSVLIGKKDLDGALNGINRASAQFQLKVTVHDVSNAFDIGKAIKDIPDNAILVVFDSPVFEESKNKLYILSKSKDKQISIVTSSRSYIDSGALLGYINDGGEKKIILNLKHSEHLRSQFTDEFIQKVGIAEVIS